MPIIFIITDNRYASSIPLDALRRAATGQAKAVFIVADVDTDDLSRDQVTNPSWNSNH